MWPAEDNLSCQGANTQQTHYSSGILTPVEYKPVHGLHINRCLRRFSPFLIPCLPIRRHVPPCRVLSHIRKLKGVKEPWLLLPCFAVKSDLMLVIDGWLTVQRDGHLWTCYRIQCGGWGVTRLGGLCHSLTIETGQTYTNISWLLFRVQLQGSWCFCAYKWDVHCHCWCEARLRERYHYALHIKCVCGCNDYHNT